MSRDPEDSSSSGSFAVFEGLLRKPFACKVVEAFADGFDRVSWRFVELDRPELNTGCFACGQNRIPLEDSLSGRAPLGSERWIVVFEVDQWRPVRKLLDGGDWVVSANRNPGEVELSL